MKRCLSETIREDVRKRLQTNSLGGWLFIVSAEANSTINGGMSSFERSNITLQSDYINLAD